MKFFTVLFLLCLLSSQGYAQEYAIIGGLVRDVDTGVSISGLDLDVYKSGEYDKPVSSSATDSKGRYEVNVTPGFYYDVYLRYGESNPSQRTPEVAREGRVYELNFGIKESSNFTEIVIEKYGILIFAFIGLIILIMIVYDVLSSRRGKSSLSDLVRERDQIQKMLDISHEKYLKREIDEETFKSISAGKQETLIELESKIKELGGKAK
ncbi:MAG: hypothetical protein KKD39_03315, partial [Candidatus Altiarchaeota archaeon]|nr:hypothetical protein [Candidatus Altiarchaeota archaeon]